MDDLARPQAAFADRFDIQRELGHGGMATVYLAHDRKLNRRLAVKVLRPELAAALGTERFLREIEIAANLSHPHILQLYDSGEAQGFLYFVMPYVEGESLSQRLEREGRLPVETAVQLAAEIAAALDYAHQQGIVHRDIKPENILLHTGQAIVADFGIARAIDAAAGDGLSQTALTGTGVIIGTPLYMSPEQVVGDPVDGRTDVYALGCVLYEMLAGTPPFSGASAQAVARHTIDPIPSNRDRAHGRHSTRQGPRGPVRRRRRVPRCAHRGHATTAGGCPLAAARDGHGRRCRRARGRIRSLEGPRAGSVRRRARVQE